MEPFTRVTGILAPLDRVNIDTDQIIPKQFRKRIDLALQEPGVEITVDLVDQRVAASEFGAAFDVDPFFRECLLNGRDEIALTLRHEADIARFEVRRSAS